MLLIAARLYGCVSTPLEVSTAGSVTNATQECVHTNWPALKANFSVNNVISLKSDHVKFDLIRTPVYKHNLNDSHKRQVDIVQ
jgi:hypothetical protein